MDPFICTPNTRLRRDIELLGPFAAVIHPQLNQLKVTSTKSPLETTTKRTQEKNLNVFHKKGSKQQDIDARRETRVRQEANRKKDNRFQAIMDKRVQGSAILAKESTKINVLKNTENKVDSRREQLLRWKEQKVAAETLTNNKAKVPVVRQAKGQNNPHTNILPPAPRKRPPTGVKIDASNLNNNQHQKLNVVKPTVAMTNGGERRVTRAMSKATPSCPYNVNIRPALAKLKNLAVVPKTFTLPTTTTNVTTTTKSSSVESLLKSKVNPTIKKPPSKNSNNITTKSNINISKDKSKQMVVVAEEEPPVISEATPNGAHEITQPIEEVLEEAQAALPTKTVKPKGMQFDEVYVEYSNNFVAAGSDLMHEIKSLSKVIEVPIDIPEDVLSDIESTLGSAKLLMDSKLPQFGQLLYFYLSKETNPNPILPCDLQGWWDVAIIQVEKVKARFDELRILEKNGWKSLEAVIPSLNKGKVLKSMKKSEGVKSTDSSIASETSGFANKKKNAQASSGLRQFLANKRKNVNPVQDQLSTPSKNLAQVPEVPLQERSDDPEKTSASSPTRKFEGGFFEVTTPIRTSTTNPNACTPRSNKSFRSHVSGTPGTKGLPRASLVTLAVRKSMGSMFKTELDGQLTNTEITSDPQPMDSCNPTHLLPCGSFSENEECSSSYNSHILNTEDLVEVQGNEEGDDEDKLPAWSPFSYDQMSIFNNSLLSSELQLIYSDWPKELTIVDSDNDEIFMKRYNEENEEKKENKVERDTSQGASLTCISFLDRCLNSESGSTYCEIFGAQNMMDSHPEFSPFDDTIDIEQSLVSKHLSQTKMKKVKKMNLELDRNKELMNIGQGIVKTTTTIPNQPNTMTSATTINNNNNSTKFDIHQVLTEHETTDLIQSEGEDESFDESANLFDESKFSFPRSIQCKVCDIYHSLKSRRKLTNFTGICTNCGSMVGHSGHLMDITSRRDVYPRKKFSHSSSQPSSDECFQSNENGSD